MKSIKAVIFDMDGLMVDTEPLHLQAFNYALGKYGKHLTEEENTKRYIGTPDIDGAKNMVVRFNLPISALELVKMKQAKARELLKAVLSPQPGLIDLLNNLRESGYKAAVASSSRLENIKTVIRSLGVAELIDQLVSAEEVKKGKPSPDVYLLAAEKLGVKPSECLVLEDAPKGVEAGKAAGMVCFAVPSQYTKGQDFSKADKVLNNLLEVFQLVQSK